MRTNILVIGGLGLVAGFVGEQRAEAITEPDLSNTCTTSNGGSGCFNVQNNFNVATNTGTSSAAGTAITSVATGQGTALKGFTSGTGNGLLGVSTSSGVGVNGISTSGAAVSGLSPGTGQGVRGVTTGTSGMASFNSATFAGVQGTSLRGYGVYGSTSANSNSLSGVFGYTSAPFAFGVMGVYQGGDNQHAGVVGKAIRPGGPEGDLDSNAVGVWGFSGGVGVRGQSFETMLNPSAGGAPGVDGSSDKGVGVYGISRAPSGDCNPTTGACTQPGVVSKAIGVTGWSEATSGGTGLYGLIEPSTDTSSAGVRGDAQGGPGVGVWGTSGSGIGVRGYSNTSAGMWGESSSSSGIVAVNSSTTSAQAAAVFAAPASTSALAFYGDGGIQLTGSLAEKAGGGSWTAPSDRRIKKDVKDLDRGIDELMHVRPVRFKYNGLGGTTDDGKEFVGVIAQELEQVLPNMISTRKAKLRKDDDNATDIEIVDPSAFTYLLINAVKQQQRTIQRQDQRISDLERRAAPLASSVLPTSPAAWVALGLLPIGVLIGRRKPTRP